MAENLDPIYNPNQSDYGEVSNMERFIGYIAATIGFSMIGIGFFAPAAFPGLEGFVINGELYETATYEEAVLWSKIDAGIATVEEIWELQQFQIAQGVNMYLDAEAMFLLQNLDFASFNQEDWDNFDQWENDWLDNDDCSYHVGDYCIE